MKQRSRTTITVFAAIVVTLVLAVGCAQAQEKKPNILVIWGDDIGYWNLSTSIEA